MITYAGPGENPIEWGVGASLCPPFNIFPQTLPCFSSVLKVKTRFLSMLDGVVECFYGGK